jgi:hypothetical protein
MHALPQAAKSFQRIAALELDRGDDSGLVEVCVPLPASRTRRARNEASKQRVK